MYRKLLLKLDSWHVSASRKPLIIKGARQVGKTYILKEWGNKTFPAVYYINFEAMPASARIFEKDFYIPRILQELGFLLGQNILDSGLLILDEIQAAPKAMTALKYFCEDRPGLAVCAAGSLLGVILSEDSFPVGKVSFLHMYPLTFVEFLHAVDERQSWKFLPEPTLDAQIPTVLHEHLLEKLNIYFVTGGMPEAIESFRRNSEDLALAFKNVRDIQRALLIGYESDFAKHAGKINSVHIQALYRNIPMQLASFHDDTTKRFRFGEVMQGKKGFAAWERPLHWLTNAALVLQVNIVNKAALPLQHYCKPNQFKLYMNDIGLLGCALNLDPSVIMAQNYGSAKGYFAENFVAQEMRASHDSFEFPLYSWQEGVAEIEFVRAYKDLVIPIEVKAGHRTKAKSLTQFCRSYDPPQAIKISAREFFVEANRKSISLPLYFSSLAALI